MKNKTPDKQLLKGILQGELSREQVLEEHKSAWDLSRLSNEELEELDDIYTRGEDASGNLSLQLLSLVDLKRLRDLNQKMRGENTSNP